MINLKNKITVLSGVFLIKTGVTYIKCNEVEHGYLDITTIDIETNREVITQYKLGKKFDENDTVWIEYDINSGNIKSFSRLPKNIQLLYPEYSHIVENAYNQIYLIKIDNK